MSIMLLVRFLCALLCSGFKRNVLFSKQKTKTKKHQNLVKLYVPFHQDNAHSDFLRSGCSQMRFVHCAALGSHYDP